MKIRRCGCIYYAYGPAILCEQHQQKLQVSEEKGLRKVIKEHCNRLGHRLNMFVKYDTPHTGKWTAFCEDCSLLVIVYDEIPIGDQVVGRPLTEECCGN